MWAKDDLIGALRVRYDHYSAEAVFEMARVRARLVDKPALDAAELRAWREALAEVGDRVGGVLERVDALLGTSGAKPATAKPDVKVEAPPVVTKPDVKAPVEEPRSIETTIVLTGVEVGEGELVLVCGGAPVLGDWNPEQARPMSRAGNAWQTVVPVASQSELAFKFLRRAADGKITWEGGDDRRVPAAPRVETVWRTA